MAHGRQVRCSVAPIRHASSCVQVAMVTESIRSPGSDPHDRSALCVHQSISRQESLAPSQTFERSEMRCVAAFVCDIGQC
jgi:hypothetical protein